MVVSVNNSMKWTATYNNIGPAIKQKVTITTNSEVTVLMNTIGTHEKSEHATKNIAAKQLSVKIIRLTIWTIGLRLATKFARAWG